MAGTGPRETGAGGRGSLICARRAVQSDTGQGGNEVLVIAAGSARPQSSAHSQLHPEGPSLGASTRLSM